jgi:MinD-like ATPase involved in chromosome partitioning or flagellar assembly
MTARIYTFYSFKGGVGRTLALANVGYVLASWGRDVLMVDADLEAPGLSVFLPSKVPQRQGRLRSPAPM